MPYIKQADRDALAYLNGRRAQNPGELNWLITAILISVPMDAERMIEYLIDQYILDKGLRYQHINDVAGAITCASLEYLRRTGFPTLPIEMEDILMAFYARTAAPYEDVKIFENGDVYPEELV